SGRSLRGNGQRYHVQRHPSVLPGQRLLGLPIAFPRAGGPDGRGLGVPERLEQWVVAPRRGPIGSEVLLGPVAPLRDLGPVPAGRERLRSALRAFRRPSVGRRTEGGG